MLKRGRGQWHLYSVDAWNPNYILPREKLYVNKIKTLLYVLYLGRTLVIVNLLSCKYNYC